MLFESLKYECVRTFLQQLLIQDKYKKIEIPDEYKDIYYIDNKVAFFLGIDAIMKFEQIINDMNLIDEYVEQLIRIFKKFTDVTDIRFGIYTLIGKIVAVKLSINNTNSQVSKDRILHYIYDKYIVNGYFYFGFSSNYINEISYIGIRHNGFTLDSRLCEINNILKKSCNKILFETKEVSITDDIIIALYNSFLSPNYLANMVTNPLISNKKYNRECFYTKDIEKIKDILFCVINNLRLNNECKRTIINDFVDVYVENHSHSINPCIAKIKRSAIGKDKLKDLDEIINSKEESLSASIGLIVDSRYSSFDLVNDISPENIEIINIPKYNDFLLGSNSNFIVMPDKLEINKQELEVSDAIITENLKVNSYGAVSVAIIGLLFIIVGIIVAVIIYIIGG